jgi:hypothetical protein
VIVIKELLIRHTEPLGASKPAVIAPQFDLCPKRQPSPVVSGRALFFWAGTSGLRWLVHSGSVESLREHI